MRICQNCGQGFPPGPNRRYCKQACKEAFDRKRRRVIRRHRKALNMESLAGECFCVDCGVTFPPDRESLSQHEDCYWQIVKPADRPGCRECGKHPVVVDGAFCSDTCWLGWWNRLIPHSPKQRLSAEDVIYSERYQLSLMPVY